MAKKAMKKHVKSLARKGFRRKSLQQAEGAEAGCKKTCKTSCELQCKHGCEIVYK